MVEFFCPDYLDYRIRGRLKVHRSGGLRFAGAVMEYQPSYGVRLQGTRRQSLGKIDGNGPGLWLRMQQAHDLWHTERQMEAELSKIEPVVLVKSDA